MVNAPILGVSLIPKISFMVSHEIPHSFENEPGAEDPMVTELRRIYLDDILNREFDDIPVGCSIGAALRIFYEAWYNEKDSSE